MHIFLVGHLLVLMPRLYLCSYTVNDLSVLVCEILAFMFKLAVWRIVVIHESLVSAGVQRFNHILNRTAHMFEAQIGERDIVSREA